MVEVKTYRLPPTRLVPNSPQRPLIHYPGFLQIGGDGTVGNCQTAGTCHPPLQAYDLFARHGWQAQWLVRYGDTQASHYHSAAHECMAVLSGSATIRFGVADIERKSAEEAEVDDKKQGSVADAVQKGDSVMQSGAGTSTGTADNHSTTQGDDAHEDGGIEVTAHAGDVFVLPAGVAHKTFNVQPSLPFRVLSPGGGRGVAETAQGTRDALADIELSGFTMIGAYLPGAIWDFATGGESEGAFEKVWNVPCPEKDPALGDSSLGLRGLWT